MTNFDLICKKPLNSNFDQMSLTLSAQVVLAGTYQHPSLDTATEDLLLEVDTIWDVISSNSISIAIIPKDWDSY